MPDSPTHAQSITNFLYDETARMQDGWEVPDIRATATLIGILDHNKFSQVYLTQLAKQMVQLLLLLGKPLGLTNLGKIIQE